MASKAACSFMHAFTIQKKERNQLWVLGGDDAGIRTPVAGMKTLYPSPLDDTAIWKAVGSAAGLSNLKELTLSFLSLFYIYIIP